MLELDKEAEELIEILGVHYENRQNLPPLAARIYAILIFCSESGHSFEELVALSRASKSSVSTSVKLLLETGHIEYYTKCGERKRYFKLNRNFLHINLKKHKEVVARDLEVLKLVISYNSKYNIKKFNKNEEIRTLYLDFFRKSV